MSTPVHVRDLMTTDLVVLEESQHLGNIETSMRALRFRHMPVVDGKKLVGLVSERDLLRTAGSSLLPHKRKQDQFIDEHFRVSDIMSRDVASVAPDAALVGCRCTDVRAKARLHAGCRRRRDPSGPHYRGRLRALGSTASAATVALRSPR